MVFGILRPSIVLPGHFLSVATEDVRLALAHEVSHIRRRDLLWATIAWLVRSVLFFNPAVWLAEKELRSAQESATDQEAVWLTGASVGAYGQMLLRAMNPGRAWCPSGLGMSDSFRNAHRRLDAMRDFTERPKSIRKLLVPLLVALGTGCLPGYLLLPAQAAAAPRHAAVHRAADIHRRPQKSVGTRSRADRSSRSRRVTHVVPLVVRSEPGRLKMRARAQVPETVVRPPRIHLVEEQSSETTVLQTPEAKLAAKGALDAYKDRVGALIADQDRRIAEFRLGADQREREAEQRETEAQQRKREGEQRARAALLREQVIRAREQDGYGIAPPGQKETDERQREADSRQREADQYQLVLDRRQRETDQWQREFDQKSIAAMREETQREIATARGEYRKRIGDLIADEASQGHEAREAESYARGRFHYVKTSSGLTFAIPDGYQIAGVRSTGKDSYTVLLSRAKG
jgi:hypothetical protein